MKWTGHVERIEKNFQRLRVQVSGNNSKRFGVDVRTVKKLLLPKQTLDYENLNRKFEHLKHLPVERYNATTPKILIGLNNQPCHRTQFRSKVVSIPKVESLETAK